MKIEPVIIRPFDDEIFQDLKRHITEVRRLFDWPGLLAHDVNESPEKKMNRFYWHDLPLAKALHNSLDLRKLADEIFGEPVIPSYSFTSMYTPEGIVPLHSDRPQCYRTIDLQINSDGSWPIYINDKPYILKDGEAVCYSGTGDPHYRKSMKEDSIHHSGYGPATKLDLVFFHYVPANWQGKLS